MEIIDGQPFSLTDNTNYIFLDKANCVVFIGNIITMYQLLADFTNQNTRNLIENLYNYNY